VYKAIKEKESPQNSVTNHSWRSFTVNQNDKEKESLYLNNLSKYLNLNVWV